MLAAQHAVGKITAKVLNLAISEVSFSKIKVFEVVEIRRGEEFQHHRCG